MENTQDNKEKFFAQYWGQEVLRIKGWGRLLLLDSFKFLPEEKTIEKSSLELIPLSKITEEDAVKTSKIYDVGQKLDDDLHALRGKRIIKASMYNMPLCDYLRSKSYALPFMGIDVETLISWGWVKLK